MCGILTYFKPQGLTKEDIIESLQSLQKVKHRGPDGEGVVVINTSTGSFQIIETDETPKGISTNISIQDYIDKSADLLLGHRRLSIIDLSSNGHQPMCDKDSGNWIVFNGEIYNYIEIRSELQGLGSNFVTQTDTEVILRAYSYWGEKCLSKFNGMFSIILFDNKKKKLFVANDRFSVKPLYYYSNSTTLIFSSEIKQLTNYKIVDKSFEPSVINNYSEIGIIDYNQKTFYQHIYRFKWAHFCFIDIRNYNSLNDSHLTRYYQTTANSSNYGKSDDEIFEEFKWLLTDAIKLRLRSDVPVGFALSGGVDSTSITAIARKTILPENDKFKAFSIVFPGDKEDESYFINVAAHELKVSHHDVNPMDTFTVDDFISQSKYQDSPVQSLSYYAEYKLYSLVREQNVRVLINGQGADEFLAGYHHHFYAYLKYLAKNAKLNTYFKEVNAYAHLKDKPASFYHKLIFNDLKGDIKLHLTDNRKLNEVQLSSKRNNTLSDSLIDDLTKYTIPVYVKCDDRDAMASSIESRHPFLDYRLVDYCFSIPDSIKIRNGWQKYILREAVNELPKEIKYRKDKKGFPTPQEKIMQIHKDKIDDFISIATKNGYKSDNKFRLFSLGVWLSLQKS